jgi:formamidopyrimidine-DNA glycosylase
MAPGELPELHPELATQGPDPLDEPISWTKFGEQLLRRQLKLKPLLMDDSVIAGIGPVYSDEILFAAGLRYDRQSELLSTQEMRRLYRSLVEVIHTAAKRRGTTLKDGLFTDLHGNPGEYTLELKAYERDGEPCLRCRKIITKAKIGGKVTYFCPDCQV